MASSLSSAARRQRTRALFRTRTLRVTKVASLPLGWHRSQGTIRSLSDGVATVIEPVTRTGDARHSPARPVDLDRTEVDAVVPLDEKGLDDATQVDVDPLPAAESDGDGPVS